MQDVTQKRGGAAMDVVTRAPPRVPSLADVDLAGKRVLIREDLNVPLEGGVVRNASRIEAALPTIERCLAADAAVLLASHLGRPDPGRRDPNLTLAPVADALGARLGRPVRLVERWRGGVAIEPGEVALLENLRFEAGETANDVDLARDLAALCDIFVMDAFATAHRAHASTCGVVEAAASACAGPLLEAELEALARIVANPVRPVVAIVGGAKVSTKLAILSRLADLADAVIVGGGIANTFLLATGKSVGASLCEPGLVDVARRIMAASDVPLPVDVMTATAVDAGLPGRLRLCEEVGRDEIILDVGPETCRRLQPLLEGAGTIVWNGPLGMFEFDQFGEGTRHLAEMVAASAAFSVAGGGDTLAAVDKYDVREEISYLSTGGGAFLEFLEGRTLPALEALRSRARM